jgi:beta-lactamase superfamily II metal-dependent hydrolase
MRLQIFDVEHGACALLTADNGTTIMIDCGHNATTGWKPGLHLVRQGVSSLQMLAITNFDEDHASGAPDLFDRISVRSILVNSSVPHSIVKQLKGDSMGPGIDRLVREMPRFTEHFAPGQGPRFDGLEWRAFWNSYPAFEDENNLSMVLFLKCHNVGVMFPGDLERAGFAALLRGPGFCQALSETNVFVAPHHGRESGCSDEARQYLQNVVFAVISDQGYEFETQDTLNFYYAMAHGAPFRGQPRSVLTTRSDKSIVLQFAPGSWSVS